jgi:hypothetical protein
MSRKQTPGPCQVVFGSLIEISALIDRFGAEAWMGVRPMTMQLRPPWRHATMKRRRGSWLAFPLLLRCAGRSGRRWPILGRDRGLGKASQRCSRPSADP